MDYDFGEKFQKKQPIKPIWDESKGDKWMTKFEKISFLSGYKKNEIKLLRDM